MLIDNPQLNYAPGINFSSNNPVDVDCCSTTAQAPMTTDTKKAGEALFNT